MPGKVCSSPVAAFVPGRIAWTAEFLLFVSEKMKSGEARGPYVWEEKIFRRSRCGKRWTQESESEAESWEDGFAEHCQSILRCFDISIDDR